MDIANKVRNLIEKTIKESGYILDEVLYVKEDGNYFLRVVIDKNGIIWLSGADVNENTNGCSRYKNFR